MRMQYKDYYITIGLEIHVALLTQHKLFSSALNSFSSDSFSLIDCALPGALPVLDRQAVEMACVFALATDAQLHLHSRFERKHYFYPDLSLGYQITQQHQPIIGKGVVQVELSDGTRKDIRIEHAHLECDAAKSIHDKYHAYTAIDLSRSGSALLEIVSDPCMHSPEEAKAYAKRVHALVSTLGLCDGKMEEGSFRVDASISLSKDPDVLGTRVEIKNISSFSFLEKAMQYEMRRQAEMLDSKQSVVMQTRLFDEKTESTMAMRDKETVHDYKYMYDPDIPELVIDKEFVDDVKARYFYDFFGMEAFYLAACRKYEVTITKEHIADMVSSSLKDTLLELYNKKSLAASTATSQLKAIFYWLPDALSKHEHKVVPSIQAMQHVLEKGVEAKEFKDILQTWLKDTSVPLESLVTVQLDDSSMLQTIKALLVEHQTQAYDVKVPVEKRIQFIMGKCMQKLKGTASATRIAVEVRKELMP